MRLSIFGIPTALVGLALVAVPAQPAKAQGFPECHQNSRKVGDSFFFRAGIQATVEVQLRYCDNDKSNFTRAIFHRNSDPYIPSSNQVYFEVNRLPGADGGLIVQNQLSSALTDGQYVDTPVVYSPNNQDSACAAYDSSSSNNPPPLSSLVCTANY